MGEPFGNVQVHSSISLFILPIPGSQRVGSNHWTRAIALLHPFKVLENIIFHFVAPHSRSLFRLRAQVIGLPPGLYWASSGALDIMFIRN